VTAGGFRPRRGDMVWLEFDPQAGHEQAGRRPAVVVSPEAYNSKVGLALFCPITNQKKGYPFEVDIPDRLSIKGVILSDQIRNLDWKARKAKYITSLPKHVLQELIAKLKTLIDIGGEE
jgi:mRNA interferase MazF